MSTAYDLYDPDGYVAGPPHDVFTRLRTEEPVVWQDMPGEPGYWAVLRHADVVRVAREPVLFSAATGGVVLEDLPPESLAMMQDMLLAMDPPRHLSYRRNVSPEFTPKVMARLEPRIREICTTILDDVDGRRRRLRARRLRQAAVAGGGRAHGHPARGLAPHPRLVGDELGWSGPGRSRRRTRPMPR